MHIRADAIDPGAISSIIPALYEPKSACGRRRCNRRRRHRNDRTLEKRNFPVGSLTLLASARSAGKKLKFRGQDVVVTELTKDSFKGIDIALFSAGGSISRNSRPSRPRPAAWWWTIPARSAWTTRCRWWCPRSTPPTSKSTGASRQPELHHRHHAHGAVSAAPGLRVKRIFASSYQAVSGTGAKAIGTETAGGRNGRRQAGDEGGLSAPDRLQRAAAGGLVSARPDTPRRR